ncbi:MAG: NAD(P)-dependent oxidoreductase [Chthoniobacterales bacterium]|nr:NAD(P)-dependent oxidoreductase [Chthoniobacterales bacterium]
MRAGGGGSANALAEDLEHILTHTAGLWEPLRNAGVFVTGGTGFFGRWLLESFRHVNTKLELGARMVVLSRDPEAFQKNAPHLADEAAIRFVRGDVRALSAASGDRFDFVIHAATESTVQLNAQNPLALVETIIDGTRAALDFAVATGAKRFLLTSSGAVYGRQPGEMTHIPEEYNGAPDCSSTASAYGEGKRAAELLCACYHKQHGVEAVIARCFAFVGPFLPLDAHFAIGNFLRDAMRGEAIVVNGDGTPYRSYLHAADLAIWLWTLLFKGGPGRCYNVGSDDSRTIQEVAEIVGRIGHAPSVRVAQEPRLQQPASRYVPSSARALSELGLRQWIDLPAAVQRTMDVLRLQDETAKD